jgi:CBS-domain-containing membrane protein
MACRVVRVRSEVRERVLHQFRFRGVRRTYGEVEEGPPALGAARVDCQLGVEHHGRDCERCPRLLSWTAGPTEREVTLRCAWLHTDPVADRMTAAAAIVAVTPSHRCVEADRVAAREGVHRLLVVEHDRLVGIVCRCDLERALSERVQAVMQRDIVVIDAAATLAEAAALMHELGVGCLPVAREQRLVGIITRGDLERAGLREELLA